jgi:hypothetical protein
MWKECIFQTVTMKKKEETIFGDWNLNGKKSVFFFLLLFTYVNSLTLSELSAKIKLRYHMGKILRKKFRHWKVWNYILIIFAVKLSNIIFTDKSVIQWKE